MTPEQIASLQEQVKAIEEKAVHRADHDVICRECHRSLGTMRYLRQGDEPAVFGAFELARNLVSSGRRAFAPPARTRSAARLVVSTPGPVTVTCWCRAKTVVDVRK